MTKHTETPWTLSEPQAVHGIETYEIHWSADGECVAEIVHGKDDAAFIVRACNAHDELVAALEALVRDYEEFDKYPTSDEHPLYAARNALAKAKGEA